MLQLTVLYGVLGVVFSVLSRTISNCLGGVMSDLDFDEVFLVVANLLDFLRVVGDVPGLVFFSSF